MLVGMLCNRDFNEATYRISFLGLIKASKILNFECAYVDDLDRYPDVILSQRQIVPENGVKDYLIRCKLVHGTKIFVIVNDVHVGDNLRAWSEIADGILTPTRFQKQLIESLSEVPVYEMMDGIDYGLDTCCRNPINTPPKLCWFGYAECYFPFMSPYENIIKEFVEKNIIEFNLITNTGNSCRFPVLPFDASNFLDILKQYDACVLSHTPLDYSVNTFNKSPNKLILSIAAGVPCITSRTLSYRLLLESLGLKDFMFSGERTFRKSLNLIIDADNRKKYLDLSQQHVIDNFSYIEMGKQFLGAIKCL